MPGKAANQPTQRLRRRCGRYRCEVPVVVNLSSARERRQLSAHCRDASEAGIGVLLGEELTLGEVASLTFSLPGTPQLWNVRAILRHRRGYHYGFEFLSLSDRQAKTLNRYIQDLERADLDEE
jgi:c-di-GMP-binding flagellar brake protein YcgR